MKKIVFVSAMKSVPWGGSEYLWSGAATSFLSQGLDVGISVKNWGKPVEEVDALAQQGAVIFHYNTRPPLACGLREKIKQRFNPPRPWIESFKEWIIEYAPDHVCVSGGNFTDGRWALEILHELKVPYSIVVQANAEFLWPIDPIREKLLPLYMDAKAVFCVSEANLMLLQDQLAITLPSAKVIRNPYNVSKKSESQWPAVSTPLKCACVGRLEPAAKGQDLILRVLAQPEWKGRDIEVNLYGEGSSEQGLRDLICRYGVEDKIFLRGTVNNVEEVWAENHVCLMPSRYEGMPLAMVEAMLCNRAVVATDVAGHAEFLQDGQEAFLAAGATHRAWAKAMERMWSHRDELQQMGLQAGKKARSLVPDDPCGEFVHLLTELLNGESL
ncbi:glycosyltransferase family 4 protein [Kiritimatiellota bacterium B12222]|nr:glycosyltransferase family 4 protein [Kiritimatiellota bacterium B12222]